MKIKGYIHAEWEQYEKKFRYFVFPYDQMYGNASTMIKEVEIEFDPANDGDMRAGCIKSARDEQAKIRAEAERKAAGIEEFIQSMLAIEHKPEQSE